MGCIYNGNNIEAVVAAHLLYKYSEFTDIFDKQKEAASKFSSLSSYNEYIYLKNNINKFVEKSNMLYIIDITLDEPILMEICRNSSSVVCFNSISTIFNNEYDFNYDLYEAIF